MKKGFLLKSAERNPKVHDLLTSERKDVMSSSDETSVYDSHKRNSLHVSNDTDTSSSGKGWKKGFLNSSSSCNEHNGKRKINRFGSDMKMDDKLVVTKKTSSALIELEQSLSSPHDFNFISQNHKDNLKHQHPIILLEHDQLEDCPNHEQKDVHCSGNPSKNNLISFLPEDQNKPLLREVSTKVRNTHDMKEEQLDALQSENTEEIESRSDLINQPKGDSQPSTQLPLPSTTLPTKLSLLIFTLDRFYKNKRKRKLKQHDDECNQSQDEIQQENAALNDFFNAFLITDSESDSTCYLQSKANILFIYEHIFEDIASHVKSKLRYCWDHSCKQILAPCWVLGLAVFDTCPRIAFECITEFWGIKIDVLKGRYLNSQVLKLEKMKLIGSLICIKMKICLWRGSCLNRLQVHSNKEMHDPPLDFYQQCIFLLAEGLPCLLRLLHIDGSMCKRTLFTVTVLEVAFCIIEYACLSYVIRPKVESRENFFTFDTLIHIKPLLDVLERWWLGEASCGDDDHPADMKRYCCEAIVNDFKMLIADAEQKVHRSICTGALDADESQLFALQYVLKNLSGIHMCADDGFHVPCSFGGIAQTTLKDICLSEFCDEKYLLSSLNAASVFIEMEDSMDYCEEAHETTAILRSCCFWLIQKLNAKSFSECRVECLEKAIRMLKSKHQRTVNLLLGIIYTILATGSNNSDIESSLRFLIGDFNNNSTIQKLDISETETVKCALAVRLIKDSHFKMMPYFIKCAQLNACKIHVLLMLVDLPHIPHDPRCALEETLFEYLPKSKYLQKQATSKDITFGTMSLNMLFETLFDMISREDVSSYLAISATSVVTNIILARSDTQHNELVTELILILHRNKKHQKIFDKHAEQWRRKLLTDGKCSDFAYRLVLESCSAAMFHDPSNGVPLSVFGYFIGKGNDGILANDISRKRIIYGTEAVLEMAMAELRGQFERDDMSVFTRLSPLLLLRRLPREHLHLIENSNTLEECGELIITRLVLKATSNENVDLSLEERRLLAEIAARSYSFSSSFGNSRGFSMFCKPLISSTLSMLSQSQKSGFYLPNIKTVLYIGCHLVQTSPESIGVAELSAFVVFAMTFLNTHFPIVDIFISEVQAGCIDFLASCICAPYIISASSKKLTLTNEIRNKLIVEVKDESNSFDDSPDEILLEYFRNLQVHTIQVIKSEAVSHLSVFSNLLRQSVTQALQRFEPIFLDHEWTPESKNDLLNAFVIASQRCPENQLLNFARDGAVTNILTMLHFTNDKFSYGEELVPSAMRFIFNMLQRRKSFDILHPNESESKHLASTLFDFALMSATHCRKACGKYILNALRQEGLKMLMVILSIDQLCPTQNAITASNTMKAVSLLQEISNIDTDSNIRSLAQQLLSCIS